MPILPPLRQYLLERCDYENVHVINQNRAHTNWRTNVQRFIRKAGLDPWPRCFHSLRASLETDLVAIRPQHVVTAWLGNSPKVASEHYLSVLDEDYAISEGWG